jgi:hypothetical protein
MKHGRFAKPGKWEAPDGIFTGIPHGIDPEEYTEKSKRTKKSCLDFGKCKQCLNTNCRIIEVA